MIKSPLVLINVLILYVVVLSVDSNTKLVTFALIQAKNPLSALFHLARSVSLVQTNSQDIHAFTTTIILCLVLQMPKASTYTPCLAQTLKELP
jgi:hypothetical protein